jgi:ABC-type glycerol-3-phosphate transport system substrate-binding protein
MENNKKIFIIAGVVVLILAIIVYAIMHLKTPPKSYKVNLEVWGLFDDSDTFSKVIEEYKKRNSLAGDIVYKKLSVNSYENDLLDALATGKGPDIFIIHNTWLPKHEDKLAAAPQTVLNLKQVQDSFPDVVTADFTKDQNVYALPLSVDSLALYVNKDYLNQAGITKAPQTWTEFDDAVKKLTKVDSLGNIQFSGAAVGLSSDRPDNPGGGKINRATDILTLLMMQSGAQMLSNTYNQAAFAEYVTSADNQQYSSGERALAYYTKFTNPQNQDLYCWNSQMHNSNDAFIEGKTAMMLNYSWLIPGIQSRAPKLNLGTFPIPQNIDQSGKGLNIDFANYWGYAVSKNKVIDSQANIASSGQQATNDQRITEAWKFLRYLTMNPSYSNGGDLKAATSADSAKFDPASAYATALKKPAARRDLLQTQINDPLLSPFAAGNLIARSWAQPDNLAIEKIFDGMIDGVTLKNVSTRDAIQKAQNDVNLLLRE